MDEFRAPVAPAVAAGKDGGQPPGAQLRPRALVVVHGADVLAEVHDALVAAGFDVAGAGSADKALALLAADLPDLVLIDFDHPGVDGPGLCGRMRAAAPAALLPIVALAGADDARTIDRVTEAGATDFVTRPVHGAVLGHRARLLLRHCVALRDLHANEKRTTAMLRAIPDMMFLLDASGRFVAFKPGAHAKPLVPPERFAQRDVRDVLPEPALSAVMAAADGARTSGEIRAARYALQEQAGERHYEARMVLSGTDEILAVVRDVTAERQSEDKVRRLAYTDSLTGLPNREAFLDRLGRHLELAGVDGERVGVIFLDLDGFKRINDTLGHTAGDYLLQSLAERLRRELRIGDVVSRPAAGGEAEPGFARLGGDEFTVLVPGVREAAGAAQVANRLRDLIARPFVVHGQELVVTASLGIAMFPDDGRDPVTLLKHADTAMYHAKDAGRNNWQMYSASLTTRARLRLEIETDLRRALERGELDLQFQPQISASDGRMTSAEALLRWNHPQRGAVAPLDYIPLAEETGMIVQVGEWVLREACATAQRWRDAGLRDVRIAVNLSGRQLRDDGFVAMVRDTLAATRLPGSLLELELTESILMDSGEDTVARLRELHRLGVHFSIDDFGTGYSSMSYLKRFPIRTLKIDQSFVRGLPADADDSAIVTAIISMARSLGVEVVAEGVENAAQADFLRQAGCDKLQGYWLSRPISAKSLEVLLRAEPVRGAAGRLAQRPQASAPPLRGAAPVR
ncbi:MAG TPA: EAL domain-containing protein [Casimicrobiaceae bacterium]|nr:EAL domain-containing protein [Casimicrobiaceae bacterium]